MRSSYDVVVLGGGPAGLAAAISIRTRCSASVLVVEAQSLGAARVGEHCPPDTILLLERLGVARDFYRGGHGRCPGFASVWGRASLGYNDSIVNPMGCSWRLDRKRFDGMLAAKAEELGVEFEWSTRFLSAERQKGKTAGHRLRLTQGPSRACRVVNAGFVVDATGLKARFARSMRIEKAIDDRLVATVRFALVTDDDGPKQIHLEATPNGWCYHTSLPSSRAVSMVVTEREALPFLRRNAYQGFESALTATTHIGPISQRLSLRNASYHVFPIHSGRLPAVEGPDWMAIGDAAVSFDPIAAQGIHKGLSHGLQAAEKVAAWFAGERSYLSQFSDSVSRQYAEYRSNRKYVYGLEQRWPTASFWQQRRRQPPVSGKLAPRLNG